jgi:hypothetical protein|tara:strand:+ start:924 stop:1208 length:285 start_codon:yes stop_codon:yes gene_type:complete
LDEKIKEVFVELINIVWMIFWLACVVASTIIGSPKEMGISSFFYGLILGPLGVVLVFISKGKKVTCPFCKKLNYITYKVCIHCDKQINGIKKAE